MTKTNPLLEKANVLVVGGAGFVGSNLVKLLLAESPTLAVTIVDNLLSAEKCNIPADKRVSFIQGSISHDATLKQIHDEFDYIFHLATFHGNQSSIHDPLKDHENNTLTTLKLYEHIKDFKRVKKVVYSSAGCSVAPKTFDEAQATEEVEEVPLDADSPYSMSKIFGEFYSKYYFKQHGVPTVRARFQNVYGPGEILGAGEWRGTPATVWRNVTPTFVYKALKKEALPLENEGVATRDFIFVEDIAKGLLACALKGAPGDVYNLASGKEVPIKHLAESINKLTSNTTPIQWLPKRPWDHSGKRFGSTRKAQEVLGFTAQTSFEEGMRRTVEWTVNNIALIEKTMSKHKGKLPA